MSEKQEQLTRIVIKGFKSINTCDIVLKNINVLVGANGAGKSNFIAVFDLLGAVLSNDLQYYGNKKGADAIFYNGIKHTKSIALEAHYKWYYHVCELEVSEVNTIFSIKNDIVKEKGYFGAPSDFFEKRPWASYHFNDTSASALLKTANNLSNDTTLLPDARNIAPFLFRLKKYYTDSYNRILKAIRRVAPYFADFVLSPSDSDNEHIILR